MLSPAEVRQAAIDRISRVAREADELAAELRQLVAQLSHGAEEGDTGPIRAAEQTVDRFRVLAFQHSTWLQRARQTE